MYGMKIRDGIIIEQRRRQLNKWHVMVPRDCTKMYELFSLKNDNIDTLYKIVETKMTNSNYPKS